MKSLRLTSVCAALLLAVSAPAWALNKCVGPNGAVVFQDAPCAGQGGPVTVKPASGQGNPSGAKPPAAPTAPAAPSAGAQGTQSQCKGPDCPPAEPSASSQR